MASPVYTAHGVGLFSGLTAGGSLVPAGIGLTLITLGMCLRLVVEQTKAATGQRPDFAGVMMETVFCFALLVLQDFVAHNVWATCQYIATNIYPDTKLAALSKLLTAVAGRFKDFSFSLLDVGRTFKDSSVTVVAMMAWALTLLAHWQLEVLQVCVFNIIYAFGPILIGLSLFGFGGRRIWFAALVEVSSWSITMAVVYKSIDAALFDYLKKAQDLAVLDDRFLDVISMLAFLTSLPFIVPIVTGRIIGANALGALANVTTGGTLADRVFGHGRQTMQGIGGGITPGASDASSHTGPSAENPLEKRPGDS